MVSQNGGGEREGWGKERAMVTGRDETEERKGEEREGGVEGREKESQAGRQSIQYSRG